MNAETNREKVTRWLSDGQTWVGVYQNQDLGHPDVGRKIAMPFDVSDWDKAKLGSRAPDTRHLIGWRYFLIAKCRTVEGVLAAGIEES
jgi:hypothetical protein